MSEKLATWSAETADVSERGCRLTLKRPLARGALVRLSFDRGGAAPFEAVGQVVWVRSGEPTEVGIAFVSAPRSAGGSRWLDVIAAAQARPAPSAGPGDAAARPQTSASAPAPPRADPRASAVAALIAESLLEFEDDGAAA